MVLKDIQANSQWLTPVILALRRQRSGGLQFKASVGKWFTRPYLENTHHKKRVVGVAQGIGPEFKPQYHKNK
jgi:hypothetical protein